MITSPHSSTELSTRKKGSVPLLVLETSFIIGVKKRYRFQLYYWFEFIYYTEMTNNGNIQPSMQLNKNNRKKKKDAMILYNKR